MLDDLLEKIKQALPESLRQKIFGEDDVDDEDDEFEEDTQTGNHDVIDDEEEDDEDDDDEEVELDDEEEKKKKKKKLIRAALGAIVVFIVVDELFLKSPDNESEPQTKQSESTSNPSKPREQRKRNEQKQVPNEVQKLDKEGPQEPLTQQTDQVDNRVDSTPDITEPERELTPETAETEVVGDEMTVETEMEPEPEPELESEVEPMISQQEEAPTNAEMMKPGPAVEQDSSMQKVTLDQETLEESNSIEVSETLKPDSSSSLGDQMAEMVKDEVQYVEPPDYTRVGRGLVYNCKGGHWACVEREAYFQCRDNMLWNDENKKASECATHNVYASEEDCKTIHIHYVNTSQSTDFCK